MSTSFDVAIVGAGDVGCALARELARYRLSVVLLEAGADIGAGTSKANTAILHTGFDAGPGSAEARLVARGHELLSAYAQEVGIPLEPTGALMVAWDETQLERLAAVEAGARSNGYQRTSRLARDELYRREPALAEGALGALEIPDEHIVCPWTLPLACATQALAAGVELRLQTEVTALESGPRGWDMQAGGTRLRAGWVVNAAGLNSDRLHRMAGHDGFTITARRGELIVFDKLARGLLDHIILPVPSAVTKGVLVAPTVFGNVLLGPTAVDVEDRTDTGTTAEGLAQLLEHGRRIMPALLEHEITASYAGLRAASEHSDYQLLVDGEGRYACAGAIRSTGLTSSLALAEEICLQMGEAGLVLQPRPAGLAPVRMANIGEAFKRPYEDQHLISADAAYGRIVCFCERVSAGELRDACTGPLPARDLDGLRRRTRATMGRCQGFHCGAAVMELLAGASGEPGASSRS